MLIQTSQLDNTQLAELDILCAECNIVDKNTVTIYRHLLATDRLRPSSLMYFDDETKKMIGFLGAFFFLEGTCEIALMVAPNLKTAVEWQNATDFGLTAGIHSLDPVELDYWMESVEAGNLYINRGITGAIVNRQPFGGWKRSSVGTRRWRST